MPAKSGLSHGFAAFVTLIVGTVLSRFVHEFLPPLGRLSLLVVSGIRSITGANLPANEQFSGSIVVMVVLSFAWGVAYHYGRHS